MAEEIYGDIIPQENDLTKLNRVLDSISKQALNYYTIGKEKEDRKRKILAEELAIKEAQQKTSPLSKLMGIPTQQEEDTSQRGYDTKLMSLFRSDRQPLEQLAQAKVRLGERPTVRREQFIEQEGIIPEATLDQAKTKAEIDATRALATQRRNLQQDVWVNPKDITDVRFEYTEGFLKVKQGTSLSAISSQYRQEKGQEFAMDRIEAMERLRQLGEERLLKRQELKEVRPNFNELNELIQAAKQLKVDLQTALDNGWAVSGLLDAPYNDLIQRISKFSPEKQSVITSLNRNFARLAFDIGGKQFTGEERKLVEGYLPNRKFQEDVNLNRTLDLIKFYEMRKEQMLRHYPELDKIESRAIPEPKPAGTGTPPPAKTGKTVMVISPDGQIGQMPVTKFKAAQEQGFKIYKSTQ